MRIALWGLASALMLSALLYQGRTGPTRPLRGTYTIGGRSHRYELPRSGLTERGARVAVPDPGGARARLFFKRHKTKEPFTEVPMALREGEWAGELPAQPAAGKLAYYLFVGGVRVPEDGEVVIRFKDRVPSWILYPHIILMFLAMLVGMRTGLAAIFKHDEIRPLAWTTLAVVTVGGLILGPVVQKFAFGEFWTGWPKGGDLTDTKTVITWLVWLGACAVVGFRPRKWGTMPGRIAVLVAALIMVAVYLIPHSLYGSELDYDRIDRGVDPAKAIRTG